MFDRSTSCLITITNYFIYSYLHYLKNILHHHLWIQLRKHICAILCLTLIFLIDLYYLSGKWIIYLSFLTNDWPLLLSLAIIHVCLTTMLDFYYSSYPYTWKFLSLLNDKIYHGNFLPLLTRFCPLIPFQNSLLRLSLLNTLSSCTVHPLEDFILSYTLTLSLSFFWSKLKVFSWCDTVTVLALFNKIFSFFFFL